MMKFPHHPLHHWAVRFGLVALIVLVTGLTARAIVTGLDVVDAVHDPLAEHIDQSELSSLVAQGKRSQAFTAAFEHGDELFATSFNALDGGGANVGQGQRFTRVPRADLNASGEWATHTPSRATGPNGQSCSECHLTPAEDGSGGAAANVIRDPGHTGDLDAFINRNTPHLFGLGALQRLAEEMTQELQTIRQAAITEAAGGASVTKPLLAKGVNFGSITAHPGGSVDASQVSGVDDNLVVKPFQWKGSIATVRDFIRDAGHNELGMQAVEIVGDGVDGDFDEVANELTVGDVTAMTIYNAAQPRPTTKIELAALRQIPPVSASELATIGAGSGVFDRTGCGGCHVRSLTVRNPIFSEPSQVAAYRDALFPAGQDPLTLGVSPATAVTFNLTSDQPDNHIGDRRSRRSFNLGAFERGRNGEAVIRLFGDLKRHDMGPGMAEQIDEKGTGASVFMTENLWGVGSTAPYLHDGRATTLTEAILEHGGEADASRTSFLALTATEQQQLIAYLNNLVLFKMEEPAEEASSTSRDRRR